MAFTVPSMMVNARKESHRTFYCPNGDPQYFPGKSDAEKLQEQLDIEKRAHTNEVAALQLEVRRIKRQKHTAKPA